MICLKQREPWRSLLLPLPAQSTKHCTLRGGEVSAGESRRVTEKKKGVTAGRVPVVNKVNQDANAAAAKHSFCSTSKLLKGNVKVGLPLGYQLHHRFSYLCHKPRGDTSHKGRSPCHANLIAKSKCRSSKSEACVSDSKVNKASFEFPFFFLMVCYTS